MPPASDIANLGCHQLESLADVRLKVNLAIAHAKSSVGRQLAPPHRQSSLGDVREPEIPRQIPSTCSATLAKLCNARDDIDRTILGRHETKRQNVLATLKDVEESKALKAMPLSCTGISKTEPRSLKTDGTTNFTN